MTVCALTVLDGVAEEATALGGVVLLMVAITLAWLSTYVADRGDHILGTMLTVGAHASLIGLGGHDGYAGAAPGTDAEEQPDATEAPEDKPEEAESRAEEGEGEEPLDIQRARRKRRKTQRQEENRREETAGGGVEDEEEVMEEEEEEEEEEAIDESDNITIRLKYLNDTEELAVLRSHDTIGFLRSKCFSGREHQIKLIWQGQLLQDPRRTLASLNIQHNSVLHCHVSLAASTPAPLPQAPTPAGSPEAAPDEAGPRAQRAGGGLSASLRSAGLALSSSSLVVPVFVVMLAVVWYFRIHYRQLFTAPATISLVGVTVFFSFFIFGMHGR